MVQRQKQAGKKSPAPERWQPQCTHIRVTRHFNEDLFCDHCKAPSDQGWVWRCTGDSDGCIPWEECNISEDDKQAVINICKQQDWNLPGTGASYEERMFRAEDNIVDIICLKPWMIKAVVAGEYTSQQIATLVVQRMIVKQKIQVQEIQRDRKEEEQWLKQRLANDQLYLSMVDGMVGKSNLPSSNTRVWTMESLVSRLETARKEAMCTYRACGACKPNLKERGWVSLNAFANNCDDDGKRYPGDVDGRPLNPPSLLVGLGDRTHPSSPVESSSGSSSFSYGSLEEEHIEQASRMSLLLHRHSNPLLNGVRKVFREFVGPSPRSQSADGITIQSSTGITDIHSIDITDSQEEDKRAALAVERPQSRLDHSWNRSPPEGRRHQSIESREFGLMDPIDNYEELVKHMSSNSIQNILASSASTEQTGSVSCVNGERRTEDTDAEVAVTEEANTLRMADIITQA